MFNDKQHEDTPALEVYLGRPMDEFFTGSLEEI